MEKRLHQDREPVVAAVAQEGSFAQRDEDARDVHVSRLDIEHLRAHNDAEHTLVTQQDAELADVHQQTRALREEYQQLLHSHSVQRDGRPEGSLAEMLELHMEVGVVGAGVV